MDREKERERNMCRMVIIKCGLGLPRLKNGYGKKNQ